VTPEATAIAAVVAWAVLAVVETIGAAAMRAAMAMAD
jgi:hypothetical protein